MHLYIGVGYGIVKLYSLRNVHITAARAHALSPRQEDNLSKTTLSLLRVKAFIGALKRNRHIHYASTARRKGMY